MGPQDASGLLLVTQKMLTNIMLLPSAVAVLFHGLICLCGVEGGAQGDTSVQTHTLLLGIHLPYSLTCSLCGVVALAW